MSLDPQMIPISPVQAIFQSFIILLYSFGLASLVPIELCLRIFYCFFFLISVFFYEKLVGGEKKSVLMCVTDSMQSRRSEACEKFELSKKVSLMVQCSPDRLWISLDDFPHFFFSSKLHKKFNSNCESVRRWSDAKCCKRLQMPANPLCLLWDDRHITGAHSPTTMFLLLIFFSFICFVA
jgi:hypothetical protein